MATRKTTAAAKAEDEQKAIVASADAVTFDFGADADGGLEGADAQSYAIPFLRVLQKLSPQCEETAAEYNPDARPGMLMNSVSGELFDGKEGVIFLPCAYQRRFLRWGPRGTAEGGYKGEVMPEDAAEMRERGEVVECEGKLVFPNENGEVNPKKCDILSDTRNHFGLVIGADGTPTNVLLSLSSTQIKKSKQLMSMLSGVKVRDANGRMVTPPTWLNRVKITTRGESNEHGAWSGVVFAQDGFINDRDLYDIAKTFRDSVVGGEVNVKYEDVEPGAGGSSDGDPDDGSF